MHLDGRTFGRVVRYLAARIGLIVNKEYACSCLTNKTRGFGELRKLRMLLVGEVNPAKSCCALRCMYARACKLQSPTAGRRSKLAYQIKKAHRCTDACMRGRYAMRRPAHGAANSRTRMEPCMEARPPEGKLLIYMNISQPRVRS